MSICDMCMSALNNPKEPLEHSTDFLLKVFDLLGKDFCYRAKIRHDMDNSKQSVEYTGRLLGGTFHLSLTFDPKEEPNTQP